MNKHEDIWNLEKRSDWTCYLFGQADIIWIPAEGKVPNAWVRFWSKIFFNCKWEKKARE